MKFLKIVMVALAAVACFWIGGNVAITMRPAPLEPSARAVEKPESVVTTNTPPRIIVEDGYVTNGVVIVTNLQPLTNQTSSSWWVDRVMWGIESEATNICMTGFELGAKWGVEFAKGKFTSGDEAKKG